MHLACASGDAVWMIGTRVLYCHLLSPCSPDAAMADLVEWLGGRGANLSYRPPLKSWPTFIFSPLLALPAQLPPQELNNSKNVEVYADKHGQQ